MKACEVINQVIARHETTSNDPIRIHENLHLAPVLDYSGKMARKAYQGYRKNWHRDRKYCGVLDFKIMDPTGKMEHSKLLRRSIGVVSVDALRRIYDGEDPLHMELTADQLALVCCIQCAFAEQEINWGVNDFQLRTHFGYPSFKTEHLRNAVPRDLFMLYLERCNAEIDAGNSIEQSINFVLDPQYQTSFVASKKVLMPPITGSGDNRRVKPVFLPYLRSNNINDVEPWVNPHLERIRKFCVDQAGTSPYWNDTYQNE